MGKAIERASKRRYIVFAFLLAVINSGCGTSNDTPAKYNIVFLLLDDMGYADIGPYGNTYHKTPNIDQLAAEGMLFTDAYAAAPNCSPTRASILTGRWPGSDRYHAISTWQCVAACKTKPARFTQRFVA